MRSNESGMSLVELLATLTLVSLVTVLIWTTFSISTKHNLTETKKLRLQQEANYIATEIQQLHRKCESYYMNIDPDRVAVTDCIYYENDVEKKEDYIISTGYMYEYIMMEDEDIEDSSLLEDFNPIVPKIKDLVITNFTVKDSEKEQLTVSIPLSISRYKN